MTAETDLFADELFPGSYKSWRYCIEVKCGVPLTPEFIQERVSVLSDPNHQESRRFSELYGETYRNQVLSWFRYAANES